VNRNVFDSSALLALILREPGGDLDAILDGSIISAVNMAEVRTKLIDLDTLDPDALEDDLSGLILVEPFTEEHARIAARLRGSTRHLGLSLGDRACLALAIVENAEAYTADRSWTEVDIGCVVNLIR
jgi:PIN domain nuclease of toxin-antitoxin system